MKKFLFLLAAMAVVLFWSTSATAQIRLSDWEPDEETPSTTQPEAQPAQPSQPEQPAQPETRNHKRIAFMFCQTHEYDPEKQKFVEEPNIPFRIGNYIQIRSALMRYGKFDAIGGLAGPDLHKRNVKRVFQDLRDKTQPGDEIFIYWESHGGPDKGGKIFGRTSDEAEQEFLYLGIPAKEELITDDEFADLLRMLSGRKVMLLMEACHSGGLLDSNAQRNRYSSNAFRNTQWTKAMSRNDEEQTVAQELNQICDSVTLTYESLPPLAQDVVTSGASSNTSRSTRTSGPIRLADLDDDTPTNGESSQFFSKAFEKITKDIHADHPDLTLILSSGENESSYCPVVDSNGNLIAYNFSKQKWLALSENSDVSDDDFVLPIGAPTLAFLLAVTDTSGKYVKDPKHTDFADIWAIAKDLIPANNDRIDRMRPEAERNGSQIPQYLNTVGPIDVRPAR